MGEPRQRQPQQARRVANDPVALAATRYRAALDRVRETGWAAKEAEIITKLTDVHLDLGQIDAAEPLIGALIQHQPDPSALVVRARYALARGDSSQAVELMGQAKELAGARWTDQDEATYREYQAALSP